MVFGKWSAATNLVATHPARVVIRVVLGSGLPPLIWLPHTCKGGHQSGFWGHRPLERESERERKRGCLLVTLCWPTRAAGIHSTFSLLKPGTAQARISSPIFDSDKRKKEEKRKEMERKKKEKQRIKEK